MSLGTVKVPTSEEFGKVAAELGFTFSPADLTAHLEALLRLSRRTTGLTK